MLEFNKVALERLRTCKQQIDKEVPEQVLQNLWLATSPKRWFSNFDLDWQIPDLPNNSLNREQLLVLMNEHKNEMELNTQTLRKLIVCVLAWGGMRRDKNTGIPALETISFYENICLELMRGLPAISAYEEFYKLHISGVMKGIGPAYYTKLIFFFGDQTGLIMDQWTARATNLLLNKKVIKLVSNRFVSPRNNAQIYKDYLNFISELMIELSIESPQKTEELIFSCSHSQRKVKLILGEHHQRCSAWRKFVVENT